MRILLLTVAGLSLRFSESVGKPCVKCLYYRDSFEESLLYRMLQRHTYFDKVVIVGGYQYSFLEETVKSRFSDIKEKLVMINNEHYSDYGSGYSLYLGYKKAAELAFDELVFAEGDLFLDDKTFDIVCKTPRDIMTYNYQPIESNKAVAFYISADGKPHYIYDTKHDILEIKEPFKAVYNSGQVWKFTDADLLSKVYDSMSETDLRGTNLVPVNEYFQRIDSKAYELIGFKMWINCNTVSDFDRSLEDKQE